MRHCILLCLLLHFAAPCAVAQSPHFEKSEAFDDPGGGYNKVLQMKNGNTLFFHFSFKEDLEVKVFDKARKLVAANELKSEFWDTKRMSNIEVAGLHEIKGEAVLFVVEKEHRAPTLYRLRIDGKTGKRIKEDEVGSSSKSKVYSRIPIVNSVFVEKDPESDCYAVIFFNGYASDPDERIKVMHFDGDHKKLSSTTYDSPDENFKFLNYIGAVVDGNNRIYIATYGASDPSGRNGKVFVSKLKAGDRKFLDKTLSFADDFKETKSLMAYNHNDNTLQLITLSFVGSKPTYFTGMHARYLAFFSYIDPESLDLKSVKPLAGNKITEYAHNVLKTDIEYKGFPQNIVLNKDNSVTVVMEELEQYSEPGEHTSSNYTTLGGIALNEINPDGTEKSGFWIRKEQRSVGYCDPLYISERIRGRWPYAGSYIDFDSYLSYDYVYTDKNSYVLFNEDNSNIDRDEDEKKRKVVKSIKKLNAICYALNGGKVNKFLLFGDPGDEDKYNSIRTDASHYDKSTNTYATLMMERDRKDTKAKLVWVKFE